MARLTISELNSEIRRIGLRGTRVESDARPPEHAAINAPLMQQIHANDVGYNHDESGVISLGRDAAGRFVAGAAPPANANAGAGAGQIQQPVSDNTAMNNAIRRAAGFGQGL